MIRPALYFLALCCALNGHAQNSVLSSGSWFKLSVKSDGIYQIDYALLKKLGAGPDQINPSTIRLFGFPNGMLPQPNSIPRQKDLREMAILVTGESDGKFNTNDKILFYGQGPDQHQYLPAKKTFRYENNLYSDKNFYFITFGGAAGKRISNQENISGSFPIVNQYLNFAQFEEDKENILHSGREWFGFEFDSKTEATVQFDMEGVVDNSPITLISNVMARAFEPASFKVSYNGVEIGVQEISTVANTAYAAKGRMRSDTLRFNASTVGATNTNHKIKYQFVKTGTAHSVGYLDSFLATLKRKISLFGDQSIFNASEGLGNPISTIEIVSNSIDPIIWDVTSEFEVKNQTHTYASGKAIFSSETTSTKKFAVFNLQKPMQAPSSEGLVSNQNLQAITQADLLIITHEDFFQEASRLSAHRQLHNNLASEIITPQQIYNEYAGGKQDITALRDFIRDVYLRSNAKLKNVLLFGRGSYDYKDRIEGNSNFVPVYESRNSLSPLETYSSDDFFGFLENHEGAWSESGSFNHTLDVGVGRFPVRTAEEAKAIVDKLIEYDIHPKAKGQWKTDIIFVADDGDYNIHQGQANSLADQAESLNPSFRAKKIYLDLFQQTQKSFGQVSKQATNTLFRAFHEGALIINFTGHGSEQLWMQERMLDPEFVATIQNRFQYPFIITATCEFGRTDDPMLISGAEKLLTRKNAGAIGLVTTSRPVNSSSNFAINSDFYETFLNNDNSKEKSIGTIFRSTKNRGNLGVSNRNFSLLGDPSMNVGLHHENVHINSFMNNQGESLIKGLTEYTLKGEVQKQGSLQSDFNGDAEIRIFEKPSIKTTKGDENPVFQFSEYERMLFQGKAKVVLGKFEAKFVTPALNEKKNSVGRMIIYVSEEIFFREATGNFAVDIDTQNGTLVDNIPPTISLFINDTTFINGGIANENPFLIAQLQDNIGIDISANEPRQIQAILDGDTTFNVTPYFVTSADGQKKGSLLFKLFGLEEGKHQIELSAYDFSGNKATAIIEFMVGEQKHLEISQLSCWPNPFSETTKIGFFHNRSGEDLVGELTITDIYGKPVQSLRFESPSSFFKTEITEWDGTEVGGSKIAAGVYILRLSLRSLFDGSKNEAISKLILTN